MKNSNVVEILDIFLQRCLAQQGRSSSDSARDNELKKELGYFAGQLEKQGFAKESIQDAFSWFFNLLLQQTISSKNNNQQNSDAIRIFSSEETSKIGDYGCNFLLSLHQVGVLTPMLREIAITQLMHLPQSVCSPNEVRWVVFIVLLSQNNKNDVPQLLEKYSLYLM